MHELKMELFYSRQADIWKDFFRLSDIDKVIIPH